MRKEEHKREEKRGKKIKKDQARIKSLTSKRERADIQHQVYELNRE